MAPNQPFEIPVRDSYRSDTMAQALATDKVYGRWRSGQLPGGNRAWQLCLGGGYHAKMSQTTGIGVIGGPHAK